MRNTPDEDAKEEQDPRTIRLSPEEAALLLKACLRYRASLPIYLEAARREVEVVDALIEKLR